MNNQVTFDQVFKIWLDSEAEQIESRDLLPVAKSKGFNSVAEWRLATALRLGMDTKQWTLEVPSPRNEQKIKRLVGRFILGFKDQLCFYSQNIRWDNAFFNIFF